MQTVYRHLSVAYTYSISSRTTENVAIVISELEQAFRSISDKYSAIKEDIQQLQTSFIQNNECNWLRVLTAVQHLCEKEVNSNTNAYDILIPLKANGSFSNNIELLYALRSIYTNLSGYRYIWIVGEKLPDWVIGVKFIQKKDKYQSKQMNIHNAILSVFSQSECADNVIFWADDNVLLNHLNAAELPVVTIGDDLMLCDENGAWWDRTRKATGLALHNKGYPTINYEAHTPVLFNKQKYLQLPTEFDFYSNAAGLCYISLYLNRFGASDATHIDDVKTTWRTQDNCLDNKLFVGYSDVGISNNIVQVLDAVLPKPSIYEFMPDAPYNNTSSAGAVLTTYGRPDLMEIQLYYLCKVNKLPVLIHDDASDDGPAIEALVDSYKAQGFDVSYTHTNKRLGHLPGDVAAIAAGIRWAASRKIDLLFKVSMRWIIKREWVTALRDLAFNTDALTLSSYTTSYGLGFRTEFFGMCVAEWVSMLPKLDALTIEGLPYNIRTLEGSCVERHIHLMAMELANKRATYKYMYNLSKQCLDKKRQGYILIPDMGTDRRTPPADVLWHNAYSRDEERAVYNKELEHVRNIDNKGGLN